MSYADLDRLPLTHPVRAGRHYALDAFRGVAVLLMLVDHVTYAVQGPVEVRMTIGRLAMPAFFLLAGNLARRPNLRHVGVFGIGLVLPIFVPFIDSPNVLVYWATGVGALWALHACRIPALLLVLPALVAASNGWDWSPDGAYSVLGVWAIMALGAYLPRSVYSWAGALPAPVGWLGRHALPFYVLHVLAIQLVLELVH